MAQDKPQCGSDANTETEYDLPLHVVGLCMLEYPSGDKIYRRLTMLLVLILGSSLLGMQTCKPDSHV